MATKLRGWVLGLTGIIIYLAAALLGSMSIARYFAPALIIAASVAYALVILGLIIEIASRIRKKVEK